MANNCDYMLRFVGKDRAKVERAAKIMAYQDFERGYHLCRIFNAWKEDVIEEGNGFFSVDVSGDCAWSVASCMFDEEYGNMHGRYGDPQFHVFRDWEGELCYANLLITMPMLCKELGVGVEIWSKESGIGFQEHFIVNSDGEIVEHNCVDWTEGYDVDDDGEYGEPNPEKDEGGFTSWGDYFEVETIYGEMKTKGE